MRTNDESKDEAREGSKDDSEGMQGTSTDESKDDVLKQGWRGRQGFAGTPARARMMLTARAEQGGGGAAGNETGPKGEDEDKPSPNQTSRPANGQENAETESGAGADADACRCGETNTGTMMEMTVARAASRRPARFCQTPDVAQALEFAKKMKWKRKHLLRRRRR